MFMKHKVCSFFGHRNSELSFEQKNKLESIIEDLIQNHNVWLFLFGSRSNFDSLCHEIVTNLKQKYLSIQRIKYTCKSESCILENDKKHFEEMYSNFFKKEVELLCYEKEIEHKTKYSAGKSSYVQRNRAMINDSDFCIFYCDENYSPQVKNNQKKPQNHLKFKQSKSGTKLAFDYAKQKKKKIIIINNED